MINMYTYNIFYIDKLYKVYTIIYRQRKYAHSFHLRSATSEESKFDRDILCWKTKCTMLEDQMYIELELQSIVIGG